MEDIFRNFGDVFGGGGGGFEGFFGGSARGGTRSNKGSSIRITTKLTLEEIAKGVTKKSIFHARPIANHAVALELPVRPMPKKTANDAMALESYARCNLLFSVNSKQKPSVLPAKARGTSYSNHARNAREKVST